MQEGKPIAYISKKVCPKHLALSTYEKEMMAIIHAVQKWRPYLVGRHFVIHTDHQSLKYFLDSAALTPAQQKWVGKLVGYDYEITYRRGSETIGLAVDVLGPQNTQKYQQPLVHHWKFIFIRTITSV